MKDNLARLRRLVGSDESFYVLVLHSFVDWYPRTVKWYRDGAKFGELTLQLRDELTGERGDTFIQGLSCLGQLGQ